MSYPWSIDEEIWGHWTAVFVSNDILDIAGRYRLLASGVDRGPLHPESAKIRLVAHGGRLFAQEDVREEKRRAVPELDDLESTMRHVERKFFGKGAVS